jgi:hypothetical protein
MRTIFIAMFVFPLCGCSFGILTPEIEDFPITQDQEHLLENTLVNNIKCEITLGYLNAVQKIGPGPLHNDISWFNDWGATATLKLTVDEKGSLSPGLSVTKPFENVITTFPTGGNVTSPQSFSFGLGVSGSADATRVETISFTYSFKDLWKEYQAHPFSSCNEHEKGTMIQSDLKIRQFIYNKLFIASVPGSIEPNAPIAAPGGGSKGGADKSGESEEGKVRVASIDEVAVASRPKPKPKKAAAKPNPWFSTFSYQITFVATYSANGTPTWKFAQVSANPTAPLFMASRQKTNDLTLTFGQITQVGGQNMLASLDAANVHAAALVGQAVATAIQSQSH